MPAALEDGQPRARRAAQAFPSRTRTRRRASTLSSVFITCRPPFRPCGG
jgi:hypothetical protein